MKTPNTSAKKILGAVEIDQAELTVRLLEIGIKLKRPPGMSALDVLSDVQDSVDRGLVPACILYDFKLMAAASIEYLQECIGNVRVMQ